MLEVKNSRLARHTQKGLQMIDFLFFDNSYYSEIIASFLVAKEKVHGVRGCMTYNLHSRLAGEFTKIFLHANELHTSHTNFVNMSS